MKLYFYILDSDRKTNKWNLRLEECKVIEKPKTYKPVTKYSKVVVLYAPNYEKAKEVFLKKYDNELNTLRESIDFYEQLKSAIEDYKEDTKC